MRVAQERLPHFRCAYHAFPCWNDNNLKTHLPSASFSLILSKKCFWELWVNRGTSSFITSGWGERNQEDKEAKQGGMGAITSDDVKGLALVLADQLFKGEGRVKTGRTGERG